MKHILAAIDFSDVTDRVLQTAERLAAVFEAELLLLHVAAPDPDFVGYAPGPESVRDHVAHELRAEHAQLHELKERLQMPPDKSAALVIQGVAAEKVLEEAKRIKVDLIVMGSHGHGALHQLLVGSVTEGVLRKAPCPVVVVPHTVA